MSCAARNIDKKTLIMLEPAKKCLLPANGCNVSELTIANEFGQALQGAQVCWYCKINLLDQGQDFGACRDLRQ